MREVKSNKTSIELANKILLLEAELKKQQEQINLFKEVSDLIVSELDLDRVLRFVCEKAIELIHAESVSIPFINESQNGYYYIAASGKNSDDIIGSSFAIEVGMCGWVLTNKKPLLFGKEIKWNYDEKTLWEDGMNSALLVPLLGKKVIIGGITALGKKGGGSFTTQDLEILTVFSNQVSTAIENATLVKKMIQKEKDYSKDLEIKISERTKELKITNDQLSLSLSSLKETQNHILEHEKFAFIGSISSSLAHELYNPLNLIINFALVLKTITEELKHSTKRKRNPFLPTKSSRLISSSFANLEQATDVIINNGRRTKDTIDRMLSFVRGEECEKIMVNINEIITESYNFAYSELKNSNSSLKIDFHENYSEEIIPIIVIPQEINKLFINLFNNSMYSLIAKKDEFNDFSPLIKVDCYLHEQNIKIKISDNATGIPADHLDKIFTPFFTTKPAGEGIGLGLTICREIVLKSLNGSINVDSELGEYTEFTITFPCP